MMSSLPEPRKKPGQHGPVLQPFPVPISSLTGVPASNATWKWYKGTFTGHSILVEDEEHIKILYSMGYFGKSNLSSREPQCLQKTEPITVLQQSQYNRRCEWAVKEKEAPVSSESEDKALLIPDLSENIPVSEISADIVKDPWPLDEELHLELEEGFFLSYGLGCLVVEDITECAMDILTMWTKYCQVREDFPYKYIAYHYFRSKGWVVTPGIKFGVDFLLYKQGPSHYHATYSVIVQVVDGSTLTRCKDNKINNRLSTWKHLTGLYRITNNVSKSLLLCNIVSPENFDTSDLASPECIKRFKVNEVLVSRWLSQQERTKPDEDWNPPEMEDWTQGM